MKMVITGGTGYIGSCLTLLASKRGHEVIVASRHRPPASSVSWVFFDFSTADVFALPEGTSVLVHLAANTTTGKYFEDESEIAAARVLIKSAEKAGARFIFVSSQAARADAPTAYGRTKWRIEQEVLSAGAWVVRPGQVYGGELRGLFGMLVKIVHRLPILPAFIPAPKIQPLHVSDLAEGLLRIAERNDVPPAIYCLAAPDPILFSKFLDEIAKSRLRCWRGFVPAPVIFINALAAGLGKTLQARLGLDRLRSLFDLPVMKTAFDLKQLGLTLRPLHSGMHPSGNDRRRRLLREGQALLTYVLKVPPGSANLRRYIRVIEQLHNGDALGLPKVFLNWPIFLSLLDQATWADEMTGKEFLWRLDTATLLAEATPAGAVRFLSSKNGRLMCSLSVIRALASEVFWRCVAAAFSPVVRRVTGRERAMA